MNRMEITGRNGYQIPCISQITGGESVLCIVSHGFGSSKWSDTAQMLFEALPPKGIGVLAFDFPAHGDSPVDGTQLRISNCIDDVAAVQDYARQLAPNGELVYFSSSFGAYINLLFLASGQGVGTRSFFRSAAVNMPALFESPTAEQQAQLAQNGFLMLEEGYARPLKITEGFLKDLKEHSVFEQYRPTRTKIQMIHGTADATIDVEQAKQFAKQAQIPLTLVPHGDHRLSIPGAPEQVLRLALEFYQNKI